MPTASTSIYWNSIDSQRSSGDSSGDTNSGSGRHYVDPWDLENYAYLRRHSVPTPVYQSQPRSGYSRLSHNSRVESDYWYTSRKREPGYDAPASVEELYFGTSSRPSTCYQPILYEDEVSYVAPISLYSPLSELGHVESIEEHRMNEIQRRRLRIERTRGHRRIRQNNIDECFYHGFAASVEAPRNFKVMIPPRKTKVEDKRYIEVIPPTRLGLNTYGHLKIDYTNSWNSLHRKISK
ncbi:uncharacterized protein LOC127279389 [Leptopilina boulardi]|uniref:uncharacterized protein LOC127279389 n=1 Tax=Leptopilina boulardi TaxID=63433 RepID=UPI0021F6509F|nr:uncharacterized protein LOC127279389 [Leptopilina boulardi]